MLNAIWFQLAIAEYVYLESFFQGDYSDSKLEDTLSS